MAGKRKSKFRYIFWITILALFGGLWYYSSRLLYPSWPGVRIGECNEEVAKYWGKICGNLPQDSLFKVHDVQLLSLNGYDLPGWFLSVQENRNRPAQGAVMLVHGGGADRRDMSRHVPFFLNHDFDVYMYDLGCSGEAPCPEKGLTFGARESRDVLSIYIHLKKTYAKLVAMGTSVGATSILISLPVMRDLSAVIAENPMYSFRRFVLETPAAPSFVPEWFRKLVIQIAFLRGRFDGMATAENSLRVGSTVPVFFIHSEKDAMIPVSHSPQLQELYTGPKEIWISPEGEHASIWNINPSDYEGRLEAFLKKYAVIL